MRPLLDHERLHHEKEYISFVNDKPQIILGKDRGFKFDHVFKPDASQVTDCDVFNIILFDVQVNKDVYCCGCHIVVIILMSFLFSISFFYSFHPALHSKFLTDMQ